MLNSKSLIKTSFSLFALSILVSFSGAGCVAPGNSQVVETSYETTAYPHSSFYLSLHHKKRHYGYKHYYKKPVCKKSHSYKKCYSKKVTLTKNTALLVHETEGDKLNKKSN